MNHSDMDVANMPHTVAACCVLHNVCEIQDAFQKPGWRVLKWNSLVLQLHQQLYHHIPK